MIKVAINGYGTIGKRVADAVDAQDDMTVVGVTKTGPSFGCKLAAKKGFPLYCTTDDPERISSATSNKIAPVEIWLILKLIDISS